MITVENANAYNFVNAIRGARNPMNSWDKMDSIIKDGNFFLGVNDYRMCERLIKAGSDERKFLRQIFVSMDITAPLFWYKEFDQYKISTTTDSCSTMHKITSSPITKDCFAFDETLDADILLTQDRIIKDCEYLRTKYLETKDKKYWRALIEILPNAWLQKRTWTGNYENLRNIYHARKNHKLQEWKDFCKEIEKLPYAYEFIIK